VSGAVRTLLVFLAVASVITTVGVANAHWSHGSASRTAQAKALPTPPPVTIIAPSVPGSVISPRARYLGVATPAGQLASFEAASGTHPQILSEYVQVGQPFTTPPPGVMPYISLETSTSAAAVIAGSDDSALGFYGRAVAAYRKPVVISIDPEMNGAWYSYGTKKISHTEFVTLFRHVHDVIEKSGAHNVVWVWAVSNSAPITHTPLLHELYPGDAYVDWVGVDGYYVHLDVHFKEIFTRVFDRIRSFTKRPFIISETSVQPGPYAAQCVQDLFAGVNSTPDLVGFIWFDYNKLSVGREDWRLEDDQAVATAFRQAAVSYAA
jgi:mannan endo-1,4-beta-mannosidase